MSADPTMARLRAGNPHPTQHVENEELLREILASTGDPRLQRRRRRRGLRSPRVLALVAVLAFGGGTAWAAVVADPLAIFQADPNRSADPASPWAQRVVPTSVKRAATVQVPAVGTIELWHATTDKGGICTALRFPDGRWAGAGKQGKGSAFDAGGALPGCRPTRAQINTAADQPVYVLEGLDAEETLVATDATRTTTWRVDYGVVEPSLKATTIVDVKSGRSAPVTAGGLFVIAVPDTGVTGAPSLKDGVRLRALDADGTIVAGAGR